VRHPYMNAFSDDQIQAVPEDAADGLPVLKVESTGGQWWSSRIAVLLAMALVGLAVLAMVLNAAQTQQEDRRPPHAPRWITAPATHRVSRKRRGVAPKHRRTRGPVHAHISHPSRRTSVSRPITHRGLLWSIDRRPSSPGTGHAPHERTSSEFGFEG